MEAGSIGFFFFNGCLHLLSVASLSTLLLTFFLWWQMNLLVFGISIQTQDQVFPLKPLKHQYKIEAAEKSSLLA
jgi:predicted Kef-type K+ transport protein